MSGIVQARAMDNGANGSIVNAYPQACVAGNFRFKFVNPAGDVAVSGITEAGGGTWTRRNVSTNTTDANGVGVNKMALWVPDAFNATSSATTAFASLVAATECFIEDDEIDPAVGFLGAVFHDNGNVAVTSWGTPAASQGGSAPVSFGGDIVVYEVSSSGGGSNVSFTAGSGRTAVPGTGLTSGHHGNATDGNDAFYQRRVILGNAGTLAALGGSASVTQNSALYVFRKRAAGSRRKLAAALMV